MPVQKKKIVIVEDDSMLLKYISAAFRTDGGFDVYTGSDGEQGEQVIKEQKPDIVLLDIIMPRKNGFEVLKSLKKDKATAAIPVIVLTNLGQQKDLDQAKKLGAADYLVKVDMQVGDIVGKVKKFFKTIKR